MVQNCYKQSSPTDALESLAGRNARGFDGLAGSRGEALVANEASGRPECAGPQTSPGKGGRRGRCGNVDNYVAGRLNRHCQCKFEPAAVELPRGGTCSIIIVINYSVKQ